MTRRWRELREAYPRIATGVVLGIAVLLLSDIVLAYKRVQYGRELARMRASMTETERQRVEAIATSEENRLAIAAELARRQALGDQPQTVGRAVSHGCVRLRNEDIAKLYAMVEVGTPVYIY